MRKTLKMLLLSLCVFYVATGYGQTIVKGKVVNEHGEAVEYVSIGLKEDSVNTVSDVIHEKEQSAKAHGKIIATYRNGYVLDSDEKVIATYANGYVLNNERKVMATYRNGYILNRKSEVIGTYRNGYVFSN